MAFKSILIFNTHSLLVGGVKNVLDARGDLLVTSILFTNDRALLQDVNHWKPDVIIMDDQTFSLVQPMQLVEIFQKMPCLRLIVLNRKVSKMDVYDKREFIISHPDHVIDALG